MRCKATRRRLVAARGGDPGWRAGAHMAACLRCQAEAVRIRGFHHRLRAEADVQERAPGGLVERVLLVLGPRPAPVRRPATAWWSATGAALAVAAAAVLAGRRLARGGWA